MGAACARRDAPAVSTGTGSTGPPRSGGTSGAGAGRQAAAGDKIQCRNGDGGGERGTAPDLSRPLRSGCKTTWEDEDDAASPSTSTGLPSQEEAAAAGTALAEHARAVREVEKRRAANSNAATEALKGLFGPDAKLAKAASVDGRLIFVVDGVVPEPVRAQLFDCLQGDSFRRTEFARPDTRDFRHHVVEYNPDRMRRTELFELVERLVWVLFPPRTEAEPRLEVYRIYTNSVMFGDAAFVHRDSGDPIHVTVLVYPNPEWAPELGGETIFYEENGEIAESVEPKPCRVVLFRGNILHKGSPPSRLFWGARYTTAFKFAPPEDRPPVNAGRPRGDTGPAPPG